MLPKERMKKGGKFLKHSNPKNCNEVVARIQSIGATVASCMDSVALLGVGGASMTHNAPCIPLLFNNYKKRGDFWVRLSFFERPGIFLETAQGLCL